MTYYKVNRIRCKKCSDILEYEHKTKDSNPHAMMWCKCGAVALDPSAYYFRIAGNPENYEDLSEEWEE